MWLIMFSLKCTWKILENCSCRQILFTSVCGWYEHLNLKRTYYCLFGLLWYEYLMIQLFKLPKRIVRSRSLKLKNWVHFWYTWIYCLLHENISFKWSRYFFHILLQVYLDEPTKLQNSKQKKGKPWNLMMMVLKMKMSMFGLQKPTR